MFFRTHVRDYIECLLGEEKARDFAKWAFGDNFDKIQINGIDGMEAWNILHSDKLKLKRNDQIKESIKKMVKLYKEEHEIDYT